MKKCNELRIPNLLKLNDWKINKFLSIVFIVQLAVLVLILLDTNGINIPILRELISVIYLLFIPGFLLLRVLRLHQLDSIENILCSVGLSIASLMFIGVSLNYIYPIFRIHHPISLFHLITAMTIFIMFLSLLSYRIDKDFQDESFISIKGWQRPIIFFICLIPFLAIIGTYYVNYYHNNIFLMIMIPLISLMPILVAFDKIPRKIYPFLTFIIAISLLFHTSLISNYLWGWDIQGEYSLANSILNLGYWDPDITSNINAMLSITILPPFLSAISGLNLIWVFKIIYPFIFSLVPVGLFYVFKKQTNDKIAFLSAFFFMSVFTFYREMLQLGRQEIAELFFVLLLIIIVDKSIRKMQKSILFILFAFCLIVSHYGLSYIFILYLVLTFLILYFMDTKVFGDIVRRSQKVDFHEYNPLKLKENKITGTFVVLFIVFAFTWYLFVSGSHITDSILTIGNHIITSLDDLFNPKSAQGLSALSTETNTFFRTLTKYLNLLFQFLIGIGFVALIINIFYKGKGKISKEFIVFSFISLILLFMGIAVPYFASALNITRLYHITLFFLAPFSLFGGIAIVWTLLRVIKKPWKKEYVGYTLKILSLSLCLLLLCFTGYVYEIAGENSSSFALGKVDFPIFNDQEVVSAKWLHTENNGSYVYADDYRAPVLTSFNLNIKSIPDNHWIYPFSYIFTGRFNNKFGNILVEHQENNLKNTYVNMGIITDNRSKIFSDGDSQIYYRQ